MRRAVQGVRRCLHDPGSVNEWIGENPPEAIEATALGQLDNGRGSQTDWWAVYLDEDDCGYLDAAEPTHIGRSGSGLRWRTAGLSR